MIVATRAPARAAAPQLRHSELAAATRAPRGGGGDEGGVEGGVGGAAARLESVSLGAGVAEQPRAASWAGRVDVAMAALGWAELPDPDGRACSSAARELVVVEGLEALVWAARRDGPRRARQAAR